MKSTLRITVLCCVLLSVLAACQKEIQHEKNEVASAALPSQENCKPIGLGLFTYDPYGNPVWQNLMLKWYDNTGKLKYVKFRLDWGGGYSIDHSTYIDDLALDYGEVSRINDEIHLKDVYSNVEILRVKVDASNRPLISWYYNPNSHSGFSWPRDTSYYSYSPSGRIESIIQHKSGLSGTYPNFIIDWRFEYDPDGNLVSIRPVGHSAGFEFRYDYTQLNHGMATMHMFTAPTKMLEFMDLVKFEQHHQLKEVKQYSTGILVHDWTYERLTRDNDGKVTSYSSGFDGNRWYTAWDCNNNSMLQSKNPTKEEFMRLTQQ